MVVAGRGGKGEEALGAGGGAEGGGSSEERWSCATIENKEKQAELVIP